MRNLEERAANKLAACKNTKDLYEAYNWLVGEAVALGFLCEDMENAILELYGDKGLEAVFEKIESKEAQEETEAEKLVQYGYQKGGMTLIQPEGALEIFRDGDPIYILKPDNTEQLVSSEEELLTAVSKEQFIAMKDEDADKRLWRLFQSVYDVPEQE